MKKTFLILAASCMMYSCTTTTTEESNPLLSEFTTEFGAPPFNLIKSEHFMPAFKAGFDEQNEQIQAIIESEETPTFENVIVALDNSSPILDRVSGVFSNLTSAETSDDLKAINTEVLPLRTGHSDNIYLNEELFKKVNEVYQNQEAFDLTTEQSRLLEKTYNSFIRSGANLNAEDKERLKTINKELASLGFKFTSNILNEDNSFKMFIDNEEDLAGLPKSFIESAAEEAKNAGKEGQWLITLHNSSRLTFLQNADNRKLREKLFTAYLHRGNNNNENNNKQIVTEVVKLRLEKANLLGFDCYANFVLDQNMAKDSKTVMSFLNNLWGYALPNAKWHEAFSSNNVL